MRVFLSIFLCLLLHGVAGQVAHPQIILNQKGVHFMREALGTTPLFDQTVAKAKVAVEREMAKGIDVPIPRDLGGGYTHEQHKRNFFTMQKAGVLFQLTQDEKYAQYIKEMLLEYARVFPLFEKHPAERSYARGKFFWQCLNDANWLVYTSQAYDNIYNWLDPQTTKILNRDLFRPYALYISAANPQFFNRIHNHSTWANAAVGMVALVIDDKDLLGWALYGLKARGEELDQIDNDGGSVFQKNQLDAGFLAQIDHSFSPNGYYTEGPYYQRYALYPFLIFAQALQNKKPELKIFARRDSVLFKAVYSLVNLSNSAGQFFPINDAQKGMSLEARELVTALSLTYYYENRNPKLLSLINNQSRVPLTVAGAIAAKDIANGKAKNYIKTSALFPDGENGDEGAVAVIRAENDPLEVVFKYAKHGMGHGHFDRLGILVNDGPDEVLQDYGAARWVNIDYKDGGGYLKENKTWAKQSVAHNSFVINEQSQFKGKAGIADLTSGTHYLFDTTVANVTVASAKENNAYENWEVQRTLAVMHLSELERPILLDLIHFNSSAEKPNLKAKVDLPFYFQGDLMYSSAARNMVEPLVAMGMAMGYQHLYSEANTSFDASGMSQVTWFNGKGFYSLHSAVNEGDSLMFVRIGANDPNFNLRRDAGFIYRRPVEGRTLFAQVLEPHGDYNYNTELPSSPLATIKEIQIVQSSEDYSAVNLIIGETVYTFCMALNDPSVKAEHKLDIDGIEYKWAGPFLLYRN